MKTRSIFSSTLILLSISLFFSSCSNQSTKTPVQLPGTLPDGRTLLSNGWILSPAGTSVNLGDFPLGMRLSRDGKFAVVLNCGEGIQTISIVNLRSQRVVQTLPIDKTWMGVCFNYRGDRFYVSGGNDNRILEYSFEHDSAAYLRSIELGKQYPAENISPADVAVTYDGAILFVAAKGDNKLYKIALASGQIIQTTEFSQPLYSCQVDERRHRVYVSIWGGARVGVVDGESMDVLKEINVGAHPNEMVQTKDGKRLFVANANVNTVSVIDLESFKVLETISTSLSPDAPEGSTPNSLALSGNDSTLYIANADNNFVAVIDVSKMGNSRPAGYIPTGWYPTVVRCADSLLLVTNGKGMSSRANPNHEYIGSLFVGTLSMIPVPGKAQLEKYSSQVLQNTPLTRTTPVRVWEADNPIPKSADINSPIKHVIYVIKENRTYDQVFGDIPTGNGDSSLCLFGRDVTPNEHAMAEEFVLLDNYYEDAEVSADGHNWSMAAYATDFVEKTWPTQYGGRGGEYVYEQEGTSTPSAGYIWDDCNRNKVSLRNYGEFVFDEDTAQGASRIKAAGLMNRTSPDYRGWDLSYPDVQRAAAWLKEFDSYEQGDSLPAFEIIKLPNDHTSGTKKGALSPRAMVADNDRALGMIVERVSRSKYWKESAIFVLEDDAQNGPDHVDAHRSTALIISPYIKRNSVDHTMYSTTGLLRTMELILGLPPMSQYDASATPMFASFSPRPDLTPFTSRENIIDLHEQNALGAYGQQRMEAFNLSKEDAVPDAEFNEILWKSVRGSNSTMPAPVRSAIVAPRSSRLDDDDD